LKPIVIIGLCVKNNEATIKEAVNGILNQNFPHELMEIIVVDGCSQDQTLAIIRETLSKADIKTRFFSENKGLGFARQIVVDNATGKYVVWVDGDVILSEDYIKRQVDFMEHHTDVGIAVGSFGFLPDDNWVAMLENVGYVIDSAMHHGKVTSKLLGTEGSIVRSQAIRMAGGFDSHIKGAYEDLFVSYNLRSKGWKFYVTDAVFYERQRKTLAALWKQHAWYGYGLHFVQHKNKGRNMFADKSNDRIIFSSQAYRLTHRKVVFLLPLNFIFRKTAEIFGFLSAHLDGYGHKCR
jgi:glycosyltransferase involved in cell wall biosynthesis